MTTIIKLYLNGTPKCASMTSRVPIALSKEIMYSRTFKIAEFLLFFRACLKIKNCTKHVFLSPFHDRIKKKGAFICQDVMN